MVAPALDKTKESKNARRNRLLFEALIALRKHPNNEAIKEQWILAARDLTQAVFVLQFASMRLSPDRDDLEQAALLEFHRIGHKLAKFTKTMDSTRLFRVLYSVARFSMLKELARLRKHSDGKVAETEEILRAAEAEDPLAFNQSDEEDIVDVETLGDSASVFDFKPFEKTLFLDEHFPGVVLDMIKESNIYQNTELSAAVNFCAIQFLRGRTPSPSLVKAVWKCDAKQVIAYAEHVVRLAILKLGDQPHIMEAVLHA